MSRPICGVMPNIFNISPTGFSEAEIKYKLVDKAPKAQEVRRKEKKAAIKVQHRHAEPIGSKFKSTYISLTVNVLKF